MRIKVIRDDGSWFLLRKGETMRNARSWKNAFNKRQGTDLKVVAVKDRVERKIRERRQSNPFRLPSMNQLMRGGW